MRVPPPPRALLYWIILYIRRALRLVQRHLNPHPPPLPPTPEEEILGMEKLLKKILYSCVLSVL